MEIVELTDRRVCERVFMVGEVTQIVTRGRGLIRYDRQQEMLLRHGSHCVETDGRETRGTRVRG